MNCWLGVQIQFQFQQCLWGWFMTHFFKILKIKPIFGSRIGWGRFQITFRLGSKIKKIPKNKNSNIYKLHYTKLWHGQIDTNYTQIFPHYTPQSYRTQNQSQICPHYTPPRPQTLNQRIKARSKLLKKLIRFRFLHYLGIGPRSSFTLFESLELGVGSEHRLLEPNLTLIPNSFGKRNFMQPMGRPKACFTFLSFILSPFL